MATRLEQLSEPGGICISRPVHTQIADKLDLNSKDLGEKKVKNIDRPLRVFRVLINEHAKALVTPVVKSPSRSFRTSKTIFISSVAVIVVAALLIPTIWLYRFNDDNADASDGWPTVVVRPFRAAQGEEVESLTESISAALVTKLGRFPLLHLVFDSDGSSPRGNYILSGRVNSSSDLIGASVQLTDIETKRIAFTQTYSRRYQDRSRLETEHDLAAQIATDVGSSYSGAVGAAEFRRASVKPIDELTPYECYLYGLRVFGSGDDRTTRGARDCLEARVEADPVDATAWALLASTYAHQR